MTGSHHRRVRFVVVPPLPALASFLSRLETVDCRWEGAEPKIAGFIAAWHVEPQHGVFRHIVVGQHSRCARESSIQATNDPALCF
jgi:hypothetical protein